MPTLVSIRSWAEESGASIAASSEIEPLGVQSLLTETLGDVWRPGEGTTQVLDVTFAGPRAVRVVALYAPRDGVLPDGAQISAALSAVAPGGTDAASSGLVYLTLGGASLTLGGASLTLAGITAMATPRGYWVWVLPATVSARYLRLTITRGVEPYLQFGRLWVGDAVAPRIGVASGGYEMSALGQTDQAPRRQVNLTLPWLDEAEANALELAALTAGLERQLLVVSEVGRAALTTVLGRLTSMPSFRPGQIDGLYTATLAIQEDR